MTESVNIDGSYGEGGGQIIRTSVSLAAITGRPVTIYNVRARRSKPGLQPQHLTAVRAAAELCRARLDGAAVGSTAFTFTPGAEVRAGSYHFDIGTAGATPLVGQTTLVPLTHGIPDSEISPRTIAHVLQEDPSGGITESGVTVIGGTHVPHAPTAEYLEHVYIPVLRRAGLDLHFDYQRAGWYPRGGGQIHLRVHPSTPSPVDLTDRGKLRSLRAYVVTSNLPEHVRQRGKATIEQFMKGIGREVEIELRDLPSPGLGAAVVLVADCENGLAGFSSLGERGKPMEKVAEAPCEEFMAWWKSGAAVDEHLADQLVLPLSLAPGESRWTTPAITEHLRTVLWVAQQFLPIDYHIEEHSEGAAEIILRPA